MNSYRLTLLAASMALLSTQAQAGAALSQVKWDGFLNAIGSASDIEESYLEEINEDGNFDETSFGLTASAKINHRLKIAGQVFLTNAEVEFDWGYANYAFNETTSGQAGKIKYPGALVSEYIDIGIAYPWVRVPESIYSETAELAVEAYTGVGGIYSAGDDTSFTLNLYGGQSNDEEGDLGRLIGLTAIIANDNGEIRLNANQSRIDAPGSATDGEDHNIMSVGVHGEFNNIGFYSEYARSEIDNFPDEDTEGWYATVGYSLGNTMPHLTYQSYEVEEGVEQRSWTLGVKHRFTPAAVLKLEVQRVTDIEDGGLFEAQPDDDDVTLVNAALNFVF